MPDRAQNQAVILHGWSDTSDSFAPLAKFLEARDFRILDLFLADSISMDDDVSIEDAARAMQAAVEARIAGGERKLPAEASGRARHLATMPDRPPVSPHKESEP